MSSRIGLRRRLLSVILPVAALSIVLTAIVVQQITTDQLQDQVTADNADIAFIHTRLNEEAAVAQTWQEATPVVVQLSLDFDVRIVLTDVSGTILLDTDEGLGRERRPLPTQSAGYIDPTLAAFDIDLPAELRASVQAEDEYERCLEINDVDESLLQFVDPFEVDGFTAEDERILDIIDNCWSESFDDLFADDFDPDSDTFTVTSFGVQPALLFLGDAGQPADVLDASFDYRMVLSVLAIGSVAVFATYLVSRRILAPISTLTRAADQVAHGGRPEPVPVTGDSELSDLAEAFNSMGTTLREEEASRRRLTTDIAHELRSPLQNIRGTLEAAQDGVRDLDLTLVESVHEEALHLQHLVDDLQILALADAAKLQLQHDVVDIGELIGSVVRSQSDRAIERDITLCQSQSDKVLEVRGDRMRLRQVLNNLIDNALRHTSPGGRIDINLVQTQSTPRQRLRISVRDTGEGIPEAFIPHVFERFSRADPSRTRGTGGSGVGLAICHQLIEAHQGTVSVTSHVGVGTTFVIDLPVAT